MLQNKTSKECFDLLPSQFHAKTEFFTLISLQSSMLCPNCPLISTAASEEFVNKYLLEEVHNIILHIFPGFCW